MSTLSVRLPASFHRQLRELAKREGVSINQLINSAVGEKLAVLMAGEYLEERARRGRRRDFEAVLAKVADREPPENDRLTGSQPLRRRRSARGKGSGG
jgi:hypothetical protein